MVASSWAELSVRFRGSFIRGSAKIGLSAFRALAAKESKNARQPYGWKRDGIALETRVKTSAKRVTARLFPMRHGA